MGKSAINPAVVVKHSTDIAALKNDLGIVEDGDTATHTIAQGQYVIWHGALYTADAAIASGTTLAASGGNKNLTAAENGGLNSLYSNIAVKTLYADQGADINNIHGTGSSGRYYIGAGVPNSPADYSNMLVISRDGSTGLATQFVYGNDACFYRIFIGNPPAWSDWHKIQDNRTLTSKSATKEHANISAVEESMIIQKGNIVEVYLSFTVGTAITGSMDELFSGLPETLSRTRYALLSTDASSPKRARVAVVGTKIMNAYTIGGIQPGVYEGTLIYIAK